MKTILLNFCIAYLCLSVQAQVVSIPDAKFLKVLISTGVDKNRNGQIEQSEALATTYLNIYNSSILDLTGIEAFTNLDSLACYGNLLTTLDLSKNLKLTWLNCSSTRISSLDLSKNTALTYLNCFYNQRLTSLTINSNTALTFLNCGQSKLVELDISQNTLLKNLNCNYNNINTLDITNNTVLTELNCEGNNFTSLDVTRNNALTVLYCTNNELTFLDISNNSNLQKFAAYNNPSLTKICINNSQVKDTTNWNQNIDYTAKWSTSCVTGIDDIQLQSSPKTLLRIYTPLGQAIKPEETNEGMYIYQYSDGSTRKIMKLE